MTAKKIQRPLKIRPAIVFPCPRYLDHIARREWKRIVPELGRIGILTRVDSAALETWCSSYSIMVSAQTILKEHGLTYMTERGYRQRPEVGIVFSAMQSLRALAAELGLSPAARQRLNSPIEVIEDEMDAFLRGD